MEERLVLSQEVRGSSPLRTTKTASWVPRGAGKKAQRHSEVAQLAEQLAVNQCVGGSNPSPGANSAPRKTDGTVCMMTHTIDSMTATLGMSPGKARHQLVQALLFDLAGRCGLLECFRCGSLVETADDLSIDHKQWWRGHPEGGDLYFDLSNVGFSHRRCNVADRPTRRQSPEGMSWCNGCRQHIPMDQFHADPNRWNGIMHRCRTCEVKRKAEERKARTVCPECGAPVRKRCRCGYEVPWSEYRHLLKQDQAAVAER